MKYFDDPEVYGISHIGWGLQPRAQWTAMGLHDKNDGMCMDARAFYGNFLFSTGPNTEVGGTRKTPCHMDIALRRCDIRLDGQTVVADGGGGAGGLARAPGVIVAANGGVCTILVDSIDGESNAMTPPNTRQP